MPEPKRWRSRATLSDSHGVAAGPAGLGGAAGAAGLATAATTGAAGVTRVAGAAAGAAGAAGFSASSGEGGAGLGVSSAIRTNAGLKNGTEFCNRWGEECQRPLVMWSSGHLVIGSARSIGFSNDQMTTSTHDHMATSTPARPSSRSRCSPRSGCPGRSSSRQTRTARAACTVPPRETGRWFPRRR